MDAERNPVPRAALSAAGARTRLVLLGTAGGSVYYADQWRRGVASAVAVGGAVYLVDCGEGVAVRYRQAGLGPPGFGHGLEDLRAIFFTHLHSDHTVGYPGLLVAGFQNGLRYQTRPIQVYGPGRRGRVEIMFAGRPASALVNPANPMPGTADLTRGILTAYATDVNERALRQKRPANPEASFDVHDIRLPPGSDDDPTTDPAPDMEPFAVHEDANVRVTATLVDHRPCFPAFGFRFETIDGAIVFSGDTRPNDNLVRLARNADILVHEVASRTAMKFLLPEPADQAQLDAILGFHTMVEEVGQIASAAGVKKLVLSPVLPAAAKEADFAATRLAFSGEVIVGQDLDQIAIAR
jgi:ribonuclease BN (tRNA processing enzyme)